MLLLAASISASTWAVILVAIITPTLTGGFLWWNTSRTIQAERERLAETLAAEAGRLDQRLSFERAESDQAELRRILDTAAEHFKELEDLVRGADFVFVADREKIPALERAIRDECRDTSREMERLRLRLGDDVTQTITKFAREALRAGVSIATLLPRQEDAAATIADLAQFKTRVESNRSLFIREALRFTAVKHYDAYQAVSP